MTICLPEIDAIHKYYQNGGRVLAMLDAGVELPNLTKMIADWGATPRNDLVIDENPVAQIFGTEPYMPLIVKYGTNAIVQPLSGRATLFPLSRSFDVAKESKPGMSDDSLCETSPDSYDVRDWTPKIKEIKFEPGKDLKGPLTVAVAGSQTGGGEKEDGRPVCRDGNVPHCGEQLPEFPKQPRLHHEFSRLAVSRRRPYFDSAHASGVTASEHELGTDAAGAVPGRVWNTPDHRIGRRVGVVGTTVETVVTSDN